MQKSELNILLDISDFFFFFFFGFWAVRVDVRWVGF